MITVFTPTYNRAYKLSELYESLCRQRYDNFEWLVVDDGSTDNTPELVECFVAEQRIKIHYVRQQNGGKHRAINHGVVLAKGEWFFIVDSDDTLPVDSLELVSRYVAQIEHKEDFAGVCGLRCYPEGSKIGGEVNYDVLDTDPVSFREKYCIKGDMAEVWRTEVLRQYPFPEYPGEKFVSEAVVWGEIARSYRLRYFNRCIYTCDYLPDGLTRNIRRHHRKNPCGTMALYAGIMKDNRYRLLSRLKAAINYWRYTIGVKREKKRDGEKPACWAFLFYPVGFFFYCWDIRTYRSQR